MGAAYDRYVENRLSGLSSGFRRAELSQALSRVVAKSKVAGFDETLSQARESTSGTLGELGNSFASAAKRLGGSAMQAGQAAGDWLKDTGVRVLNAPTSEELAQLDYERSLSTLGVDSEAMKSLKLSPDPSRYSIEDSLMRFYEKPESRERLGIAALAAALGYGTSSAIGGMRRRGAERRRRKDIASLYRQQAREAMQGKSGGFKTANFGANVELYKNVFLSALEDPQYRPVATALIGGLAGSALGVGAEALSGRRKKRWLNAAATGGVGGGLLGLAYGGLTGKGTPQGQTGAGGASPSPPPPGASPEEVMAYHTNLIESLPADQQAAALDELDRIMRSGDPSALQVAGSYVAENPLLAANVGGVAAGHAAGNYLDKRNYLRAVNGANATVSQISAINPDTGPVPERASYLSDSAFNNDIKSHKARVEEAKVFNQGKKMHLDHAKDRLNALREGGVKAHRPGFMSRHAWRTGGPMLAINGLDHLWRGGKAGYENLLNDPPQWMTQGAAGAASAMGTAKEFGSNWLDEFRRQPFNQPISDHEINPPST